MCFGGVFFYSLSALRIERVLKRLFKFAEIVLLGIFVGLLIVLVMKTSRGENEENVSEKLFFARNREKKIVFND